MSYLYNRFCATPAFTKKMIEEFCEHRLKARPRQLLVFPKPSSGLATTIGL